MGQHSPAGEAPSLVSVNKTEFAADPPGLRRNGGTSLCRQAGRSGLLALARRPGGGAAAAVAFVEVGGTALGMLGDFLQGTAAQPGDRGPPAFQHVTVPVPVRAGEKRIEISDTTYLQFAAAKDGGAYGLLTIDDNGDWALSGVNGQKSFSKTQREYIGADGKTDLFEWCLRRLVVRPVTYLREGVMKVAAQDFRSSVPVAWDDEVGDLIRAFNAMAATLREARDQQQREFQREKITALGELSLALAHEIRNPVGVINTAAKLLENAESPDKRAELQRMIREECQRLDQFLKDFQQLARHRKPQLTHIDPAIPLDKALRVMLAGHEGITVRRDYNHEGRHICADPELLQQAWVNLVRNAKEAMQGRGELQVGSSVEGGEVLLYLQDSGPGIDSEQLQRIFEPFAQAGRSPSNVKGTGLGLAINKSFVEMMGGNIGVDSTPGEGSLFHFELPLMLAEAEDIVNSRIQPPNVQDIEPGQTDWRILIVEDMVDNRLLLRSLLEHVGFNIREAENGEQAVALFKQWQPHFIWMDMRMPVMDGYAATRKIRALPDGDQVKIVALTASAFKDQRQTILDEGCDDVLHKPYQSHEIFEALERLLGVRFIYDQVDETATQSETAELTPESLMRLPEELKNSLSEAVSRLDTELTGQLLEQIAEIDEELAHGLQRLVDSFNWGQIQKLLKNE